MKLSNYLYFIRKRTYSNKKILILSYLIASICFALICFSLDFPWIFSRAYRDVDELLPTGIDNCVVVDMDSMLSENHIVSTAEEGKNFILDLLACEEIYGIGDYDEFKRTYELTYDGINYGSLMNEISKAHPISIEDGTSGGGVQTIAYSYYFKDFYQFDLYKGDFDNIESLEAGDVVLYLGYNFRDVPIGAALTDYNYSRKEERTIRVAGIIAEGEEIIDISSASTNFAFDASYGHNLDNMVVFILGKYSDDDYMMTYNTLPVAFDYGVDFNEGVNIIYEIAEKNGISANVIGLKNKMQTQLSSYDVVRDAVASVCPIAFFITAIIIFAMQLLMNVMRNDELGVWLSNGFTRHNILILLLLDNLKKLFFSSVIGSVLASIYLAKMLMLTKGETDRLFFDIYGYGAICTFLVALFLAFVLSLATYKLISRKCLRDIIYKNGNDNYIRGIYRQSGVFAGLFIVSFIASFLIMYYVLNIYREYSDINREKAAYNYAECYDIFINTFSEESIQPDLRITKGNLYEKVRVPIGNREYGDRWAYLLINQNESILETSGGKAIGIVEPSSIPSCVIGDRWVSDTYEIDREKYIKIYDTDVKVLAVLDSNSLVDRDKRIYLFANTLNSDIMLKWFGYGYDRGVLEGMMCYTCSSKNNDIGLIESELNNIYGEGAYTIEVTNEYWEANEEELSFYLELMEGFLGSLSILSIFNMLFLSLVWSKTYAYEFMVKRIFGYKTIMLLPGILKTIVLYEIPAFVGTLVFTLIYELIFNDFSTWINNLTNGYFIVAGAFVGLAVMLAVKPLFWIAEARPADYVRCKE